MASRVPWQGARCCRTNKWRRYPGKALGGKPPGDAQPWSLQSQAAQPTVGAMPAAAGRGDAVISSSSDSDTEM